MRRTIALVAAALIAGAAWSADPPATITNARIEERPSVTPSAALDEAGRGKSATWVGWSVPALAKAIDVCCFTNNFKRRGCSLASRDTSWGTSDDFGPTDSTELFILVESKAGAPHRLKIFGASCPVDGADQRLVWLGPVDAGASLAALSRLLETESGRDGITDPALGAVAYHKDARADALLEKRVLDRSLPMNQRQKAVFWAGQARGEAGYKLIDRVLESESNHDLREHAVFALSQSDVPKGPERIKRVAVEDREPHVRAHAYFSLSQTRAADAGAWIVGRLDAEEDDHVREQAVFALSQLDDGTDWLVKVLRNQRDPQMVRRALFWLAQSNDPRALTEIEKILDP
jgi:hypothetical protein